MSARPRVHTILSLLAEDHAPVHLRPSILLAVDWPTVAEEAPATGDDALFTAAVASLLSFGERARENHPPRMAASVSCLAARLATVAASLAASSDKAMAAHATALWGAAAALAGMPTTAPPAEWSEFIDSIVALTGARAIPSHTGVMLDAVKRWRDKGRSEGAAAHALGDLARKASDIIPGALINTIAGQRDLIATALDRVASHWLLAKARGDALSALGWDGEENLAEWTVRRKQDRERPICKPLREILGLRPHGTDDVLAVVRNLKASEAKAHADLANLGERFAASELSLKGILSSAVASADECVRLQGDNARLRAQVDRMVAAMREDAPLVKSRPQPGDRVPWAEVEDGALYYRKGYPCPFCMVVQRCLQVMSDAADGDIVRILATPSEFTKVGEPPTGLHEENGVLVARDLGTDPEAWRRAMRDWTANGNRPAAKDDDMPQPGDEDWRNGATGRVR